MTVPRDTLSLIRGHRLQLRLISRDDAAYVHGLRTNPAYNAHLSPVTGTVDDQRRWIDGYRPREDAGLEYYYVIERLDGLRCGTVRLYDIGAQSFIWGSWILDHNKPAKAALESAVLSFGAGFYHLGLAKALIDVRHANTHAAAFYHRFGAVETRQDAHNIYFELTRDSFARDRAGYFAAIAAGGPLSQ